MNHIQIKQTVRTLITWSVIVAMVFFLVRSMWVNVDQIKTYEFSFELVPLILSFIIYGIGLACLAIIMFVLLKYMRVPVAYKHVLKYTLYSQFGSYIPGKLWLYAIKYNLLKKHGVTFSHFSILFAIEAFQLIATGGVLAFIFTSALFEWHVGYQYALYALVVIGIICLHPRIFYSVVNLLLPLIKKERILREQQVPYHILLLTSVGASLYWLLLGIAFFFFVQSFTNVTYVAFIPIVGALLLAYWVGVIAVFAPSGIGVREGIFTIVLSTVITQPIAVVVSIVARVWSSANELFWAVVAFVISKDRLQALKNTMVQGNKED